MTTEGNITYKNGDEVRVLATGQVVVLTDINTHADYKERDEIWAEARNFSSSWGNVYLDDPADVELVRRAEDIPPKALPTPAELVGLLSSAVLSEDDGTSIDETDSSERADGTLLAYGTSATGQRFACRIAVTEIDWADF